MTSYRGLAWLLSAAALSGCGSGGDTANETPADRVTPGAGANRSVAEPPLAFAVCSSCHAVQPGRSGVGPSLAGIWGRKAGSLQGYAYSAPLKASGIVWDRASLDTWLQGPMKMVPGTRMVIGMTDPTGRKAVIDYLETLK